MHGPLAVVALRNARMEMNRDKRPLRHLKSNKTLRMSFASTRSLAVGSIRALYDASVNKMGRLLRKDRVKNECRYCDEDMDAQGSYTRHELVNVDNQSEAANADIELMAMHSVDQDPPVDLAAQSHSNTTTEYGDGSADARSRPASPV